jgi:hypothetical protein
MDERVLLEIIARQQTDSSVTQDQRAVGFQGNNDPKPYSNVRRPKLSLTIPYEQPLKSLSRPKHTPQSIQVTHIPTHGPLLNLTRGNGRMRQSGALSTARRMSLKRLRTANLPSLALGQANSNSLLSEGSGSSRLPPLLPEASRPRRCELPRLRSVLGVSQLRGISNQCRRFQFALVSANGRRHGRTSRQNGAEMDFRTGPSSCGMFWPPF